MEKLSDRHLVIFRHLLKRVSEGGKTITYKELTDKEGVGGSPRTIGRKYLDDLSRMTFARDGRLISAIVLRFDGFAGEGLEDLILDLGLAHDRKSAKNYAVEERQRVIDQYQHEIDFFTLENLVLHHTWYNQPYDKNDPQKTAVLSVLNGVLSQKTKYWATQVAGRLEGFESSSFANTLIASWYDSENGKEKGQIIRPYTWGSIYSEDVDAHSVYFTVGTRAWDKQLEYRIGIDSGERSALSAEQQKELANAIPFEARSVTVPVERLKSYCWESLIQETVSFVELYLDFYNRMVEVVKGELSIDNFVARQSKSQMKSLGKIEPVAIPAIAIQEAAKIYPEDYIDPSGRNINFLARAARQQMIGDAGEKWVLDREQERTAKFNLTDDQRKAIRITPSSAAYDIDSFDEDGEPVMIEVKTTTLGVDAPFYMSKRERDVMKQQIEMGVRYRIHRVYNLSLETGDADCLVYDSPEEMLSFAVMKSFKVTPK